MAEDLCVTLIAESKFFDLFESGGGEARPTSETIKPLEHLGSLDI